MHRRRVLGVLVGMGAGALAAMEAAACSSDSSSPSAVSTGDAEPETSGPVDAARPDVQVTNPNQAKQTGRIIDGYTKAAVAAPVITIAGRTMTGGDDGTYEIVVPKNTPYSMVVTAADHWKLDEQEWIVKSDVFARMDTSLLSTSVATILSTLLPPHDPAKGILAVRVYPVPPCTSEAGSVISIAPAGSSKITYFAGGMPSKSTTSAVKDEAFSAAITDVEPGVNVTVTIASPTCEQLAFPVDFQGATYTGVQKTEAGDVVSFMRVFVGPTKIADAGTD